MQSGGYPLPQVGAAVWSFSQLLSQPSFIQAPAPGLTAPAFASPYARGPLRKNLKSLW